MSRFAPGALRRVAYGGRRRRRSSATLMLCTHARSKVRSVCCFVDIAPSRQINRQPSIPKNGTPTELRRVLASRRRNDALVLQPRREVQRGGCLGPLGQAATLCAPAHSPLPGVSRRSVYSARLPGGRLVQERGMTVRTRWVWMRNSCRKPRSNSAVTRRSRRRRGRRSRVGIDVGLRRGHLPGVAEAEHAAQALLGYRGADLADRGPITAAGMWSKEFCPHGRDAQSIAFFNAPGMERLYSG